MQHESQAFGRLICFLAEICEEHAKYAIPTGVRREVTQSLCTERAFGHYLQTSRFFWLVLPHSRNLLPIVCA